MLGAVMTRDATSPFSPLPAVKIQAERDTRFLYTNSTDARRMLFIPSPNLRTQHLTTRSEQQHELRSLNSRVEILRSQCVDLRPDPPPSGWPRIPRHLVSGLQ